MLNRDNAKFLQRKVSAHLIILCSTVILVINAAYIVDAELLSHLKYIQVFFARRPGIEEREDLHAEEHVFSNVRFRKYSCQ